MGERNCQDDLLARAWGAVTAGWVSGQAEFQRQVERDGETKCSIWESLTLSRSAVSWLQQLSTDPQSSVLEDHANQKTASLRRPSVVMLTACERKNQNTPWDTHTHTEIVCHCGNSAEENSSPFPSVKPPSLSFFLSLRESKLLYLSISSHCSQICLLEHVKLSYLSSEDWHYNKSYLTDTNTHGRALPFTTTHTLTAKPKNLHRNQGNILILKLRHTACGLWKCSHAQDILIYNP